MNRFNPSNCAYLWFIHLVIHFTRSQQNIYWASLCAWHYGIRWLKNQTWFLTLWSLPSKAGGMGWISKWKEDYRIPGCGKAITEEEIVMRKNRKHSFKLVYWKKKDHWASKRGTEENTSRRKQQVWKPGGRKECSVFGKTRVAGTVNEKRRGVESTFDLFSLMKSVYFLI